MEPSKPMRVALDCRWRATWRFSLILQIAGLITSPIVWAAERPFTAADSVTMTQIIYSEGYGKYACANGGERCAIVLRNSSLETGLNEFSLSVVEAGPTLTFVNDPKATSLPLPRPVVRFSTDYPYDAIDKPQWSTDGKTVYFIGRKTGAEWIGQVYSYDLRTSTLSQLTWHPYNVVQFAVSENGKTIVYAAKEPPDWQKRNQHGYVVEGDTMEDVLSTNPGTVTPFVRYYTASLPGGKPKPIAIDEPNRNVPPRIFLSPSGRWAVVPHYLRKFPAAWQDYALVKLFYGEGEPLIESDVSGGANDLRWIEDHEIFGGFLNSVFQFDLVNVVTGNVKPLIDAPTPGGAARIHWEEDLGKVTASATYAPLFLCDEPLRAKCLSQSDAEVEVDLLTGQASLIGFSSRIPDLKNGARLQLTTTENSDAPPEILAIDRNTGASRIITDLNPQLRHTTLGHVEAIKWKSAKLDAELTAGLVFPPDYKPGHKYPLVIQDYGFSPEYFYLTGPADTAFSGRALANRGVLVLNIGCWVHATQHTGDYQQDGDPPRSTACFESAVDELDGRGLIDRNKVGLIGFSASGVHIMNTIAFSSYHFAAATIADSNSATPYAYAWSYGSFRPGMMQWEREWLNSQPLVGDYFWGDGIKTWIERSPVYHLDRVRTALRYELVSYPPDIVAAPGYWDVYAILKRMHRPAEMIRLPNDEHNLQTPFKRFTSQQGNADWFAFWLKNEERTTPIPGTPETKESLREQYARWARLKAQYDAVMELPPPPPATFKIPYKSIPDPPLGFIQ